jgi:hypothetical protein
MYLFDVRLGLPLPGPGGKGIATLAQVVKDDSVLRQLDADKLTYDIKAEDAGKAEFFVHAPLSGLTTRMAMLQGQLAQSAPVKLEWPAMDEVARLRKVAQGADGKALEVSAWREDSNHDGPGLLRRFLPPDAGTDKGAGKRQLFVRQLVPASALPQQLGVLVGKIGPAVFEEKVGRFYSIPFLRLALEPKQPRDRLLRGDWRQASEELTRQGRHIDDQEGLFRAQSEEELTKGLVQWADEMAKALDELLELEAKKADPERIRIARAQVQQLWQRAEALAILLQGRMALPLGGETAYQLALCIHERAERAQARIDLRRAYPASIKPEEWDALRRDWSAAEGAWRRFGQDRPVGYNDGRDYGDLFRERRDEPQRRSFASAGRMRGRAYAMLAEAQAAQKDAEGARSNRDLAVKAWSELPAPLSPLEQVAGNHLARQLQGKGP